MSENVPGPRVRLASPAGGAAVLFVLTMATAVASVPLAVLARQAAGSSLIYHAAVTLLNLVLGGVGVVVAWHQPRNPMGVAAAGLWDVLRAPGGWFLLRDARIPAASRAAAAWLGGCSAAAELGSGDRLAEYCCLAVPGRPAAITALAVASADLPRHCGDHGRRRGRDRRHGYRRASHPDQLQRGPRHHRQPDGRGCAVGRDRRGVFRRPGGLPGGRGDPAGGQLPPGPAASGASS